MGQEGRPNPVFVCTLHASSLTKLCVEERSPFAGVDIFLFTQRASDTLQVRGEQPHSGEGRSKAGRCGWGLRQPPTQRQQTVRGRQIRLSEFLLMKSRCHSQAAWEQAFRVQSRTTRRWRIHAWAGGGAGEFTSRQRPSTAVRGEGPQNLAERKKRTR